MKTALQINNNIIYNALQPRSSDAYPFFSSLSTYERSPYKALRPMHLARKSKQLKQREAEYFYFYDVIVSSF